MATLFARVSRANARMSYRRSPHVPSSVLASHIRASGSLAWRETFVSVDCKSFSTRVSRDPKTRSHSDNGERHNAAGTMTAQQRREAFHSAVLKKTQWIEELADRNAFDMMLRVVYECYKPLYETHGALRGVQCSLWESYDDEAAVTKETTQYAPKSFNDVATRSVEVKTMELFLARKRPDLAVAVYDHRNTIASKVGIMRDRKTGYITDLPKHYKGFWLAAMAAFRKLDDHEEAVAVYVRSVQTGAEPSAAMTSACLTALLAIEDHEAVRMLYDVVKDTERPVDYEYYKRMLHFAGAVEDSALMDEILHVMEANKVVLRSEDYFSAIRSLDGQYFQAKTTVNDESAVKSPAESYQDCLDREADQEAVPEAHARVQEACSRVVRTFDEMVDVAKIVPSQKAFFPRVMRAAMLLQDYERVTKYADMYEQVFGKPITGNKSLVMATNALLLQENPIAAWEFVIKAYEFEKETAKQSIDASSGVWTALSSILQYLGSHKDLSLTCQFLDALKAKMLLFLFRRDQRQALIQAVVSDTEHVSDSTVLELLRQYGVAFSVRSKVLSLKDFADACVDGGRWSLLLQVLKSRDEKRLRSIPGWLAVPISEAAVIDVLGLERMELVAELMRMVELVELDESERVTLSRNAAVAVRALYDFHDGAGMRMSQYYEREISRLHERLRDDQPKTVSGDAEDPQELETVGVQGRRRVHSM